MQPIWGTNNKKIQGLDGALWNLIIDKCVEYLMHVSRVNTSPREESKLWFFIISVGSIQKGLHAGQAAIMVHI